MKVQNPIASGKASGRALGGVFSSNRGMETFKKYVRPYQPNTAEQGTVKTRFSYLTKYWKMSLTYAQITLWNNWNLPWTDIYGDTVLLTGINKFVICNDTLLRAGKPITPTPPTETPSELTVIETIETPFIKLSVEGITDAEVTAQVPFIRVQVPGTPQELEDNTGQLDIHWNGMPISRKPLEKNWKTIYYYTCRTGFEGVEELKIIIQTVSSLRGLQPIRLQRFNKWGYWSGQVTYINPIASKNVLQNSAFNTSVGWTLSGGASVSGGKLIMAGSNLARQEFTSIIGHTYQAYVYADSVEAGGQIEISMKGGLMGTFTTPGQKIFQRTVTRTDERISIYSPWAFTSVLDDFFLIDIT